MIPAGWRIDDDKRDAVERVLAALPNKDRGLLVVVCGTIVANSIADVAFDRGGGIGDATDGAISFYDGLARVIMSRMAQ